LPLENLPDPRKIQKIIIQTPILKEVAGWYYEVVGIFGLLMIVVI
jgi:hypothetical protein